MIRHKAGQFLPFGRSFLKRKEARWTKTLSSSAPHSIESKEKGLFQVLIKEVHARMISSQPVLVPQEVMHFIGEYQFFEFDMMFAKLANQIHRLAKRYIAIVVAVYQQYRRFPFVHRRDRRRLASQLVQIRRTRPGGAASTYASAP